jgi:hypothetical protein
MILDLLQFVNNKEAPFIHKTQSEMLGASGRFAKLSKQKGLDNQDKK